VVVRDDPLLQEELDGHLRVQVGPVVRVRLGGGPRDSPDPWQMRQLSRSPVAGAAAGALQVQAGVQPT
jgi:hypothetical protein